MCFPDDRSVQGVDLIFVFCAVVRVYDLIIEYIIVALQACRGKCDFPGSDAARVQGSFFCGFNADVVCGGILLRSAGSCEHGGKEKSREDVCWFFVFQIHKKASIIKNVEKQLFHDLL